MSTLIANDGETTAWEESRVEAAVAAAPRRAARWRWGMRNAPIGYVDMSQPIGWQVLFLALPMLGEQFFNFLVGLVDTYLAGHVSKEATAAVGTGAYMGWFATLVFALAGTGASALVSRCWGAKERATGRRALNQAVVLALALGLTTSITVFAAAPWLADFLAAQLTPEAHAMFIRYVRIDCWGYVLYSIVLVCGGIVRAAGDTRTPMRIMIGVNFANALISSSLVFGWFGQSFGASGIAFGTVMARTIGGLLMIYVLTKGLDGLKLNWREMKPDFEILQRILRVGLPAAADAGVMWLAQMAFIKIIASTGHGAAATANYAAHMIAMRFEALTYLPAMAWMTAAATLVGQYLGADDQRRATRAGHIAALQGACLTMIVSVSFWTMAGMLYSLFTQDSAVRDVGTPALRLLGFIQPVLAMAIIYMGALRGAGDTRTTMGISVIGGLVVRLPLAYLGGIVLHGGLIGAWCGMWADNITKFVLGLARFAHGGWRRVKV